MPIVSQSEFRANMSKLLDQVEDDSKELIIFRQGKQAMVVIPMDEYESWKETAYLLSTQQNAKALRASLESLDSGEGVEVEFDENGTLVPVDKSKKNAA